MLAEIAGDSSGFRERVRATLTRLSRTGHLPALPGVATAALAIAREPDGDMKDLAKVLQTDVGLTACILRVANSPAYGRRSEAHTVREAVMTVGLRRACDILVAICAKQLYAGQGRYTEILWNHSLAVAVAAEEVARVTRRVNPDTAFLPGLLHDIGRIAFRLADAQSFEAIQERVEAGEGESTALERECYEFDHAQVGGILTEDWGLTPEQCDAIRWHHEPDCADAGRDLAPLINAADSLAYAIGLGTYREPPADVSVAALGLSSDEEAACAIRAREEFDTQKQLIG